MSFNTMFENYLENLLLVGKKLGNTAPPARIITQPNLITFKFTPIGEKYIHHVYVRVKSREDLLIIATFPPYALYHFLVVSAFLSFFYPSLSVVANDEIRTVMSNDIARVKEISEELWRKDRDYVLIPYLSVFDEASFEGYLYEVENYYVAFPSRRDEEAIDVIKGHREEALYKKYYAENIEFVTDFVGETLFKLVLKEVKKV